MRIRDAMEADAAALTALRTEAYADAGPGVWRRGDRVWSRPYQADAHLLYESLGYLRVPERDGEDPDGRRWVFRLDLLTDLSPRLRRRG